jgi:ribose/xylose/arabinose/galactoside ABC-type transport system permease subunit
VMFRREPPSPVAAIEKKTRPSHKKTAEEAKPANNEAHLLEDRPPEEGEPREPESDADADADATDAPASPLDKSKAGMLLIIGVITLLVTVLGLNGWARDFIVIEGIWANPNATTPGAMMSSNQTGPAPGMTYTWRFHWWYLDRTGCPQTAICAPRCHVNCTTTRYSWRTAPWPYCPTCDTEYPWTVALYTILAAVCIGGAVAGQLVLSSRVKRAVATTFFSYVFALLVFLCRQRILINLRDRYDSDFARAPNMAQAYHLTLDPEANRSWRAMVVISYLMPALSSIWLLASLVMACRAPKEDLSNAPSITVPNPHESAFMRRVGKDLLADPQRKSRLINEHPGSGA